MSDDTKYAREDVLKDILHGWDPLEPPPDGHEVTESLARLDRADPLRAIMGEVANELEHILNWVPLGDKARTLRIRDLFVKIRKLTPTEGGTDDGAQ